MKRSQILNFLEPAAVFLMIMLYIWRLRTVAPYSWILIVAFVVATHVLRRESVACLGFRTSNFKTCLALLTPPVLLLAGTLMAVGWFGHTMRQISLSETLLILAAYCLWGLFQQYLLNGYLATRLIAISPMRFVPLIAAAIFAIVHLPNWFLMLVTFLLGYVSANISLRYRNVYVLGLAHGLIGTLLFLVIPDSISHHLSVGPGFYLH